MSAGDADKMKAMVDVQWACMQIASMSGAAGNPEFLVESDDEDADISAATSPERHAEPESSVKDTTGLALPHN